VRSGFINLAVRFGGVPYAFEAALRKTKIRRCFTDSLIN
jgi:hypothetical protein